MSKTKTNLHTIICDYVPLYEYREEVCSIKILEKIKVLKKRYFCEQNLIDFQ